MTLRKIKEAQSVTEQDVQQLQDAVSTILNKVRNEGDVALRHYAKKFDNFEKEFRVTHEEVSKAKDKLPPEVIEGARFRYQASDGLCTRAKNLPQGYGKRILSRLYYGT